MLRINQNSLRDFNQPQTRHYEQRNKKSSQNNINSGKREGGKL